MFKRSTYDLYLEDISIFAESGEVTSLLYEHMYHASSRFLNCTRTPWPAKARFVDEVKGREATGEDEKMKEHQGVINMTRQLKEIHTDAVNIFTHEHGWTPDS